MTVFTEARHAGEFILSEANGKRSRENVTIAASQTIVSGAVLALLAQVAGVTSSAAADAGNTGTGALTLANPAVSGRVKNGTYRVVCVEPGSGGGRFLVEDPEGRTIGAAVVGVAFMGEVKFTIADGDPDFAVGDSFSIKVGVENPGDYQAVAFDQDGTDGSEIAGAIAIYPATTGEGETVKIAALVREAEVNGNILTWPEDIEAAEKAAAIAQLAAVGIVVR